MTLFRTKDGRYLAAAGREAAPEGAEVVEQSKLSLNGLQAAIQALSGRPCGRPESRAAGLRRLGKLLGHPAFEKRSHVRPPAATGYHGRQAVASLRR